MSSVHIVFLSLADIVFYTVRGFTNKLFALSYDGKPSAATPVFSTITGFSGFLFTILFSEKMVFPNTITLLCGISAGCILFLYDWGNIRAAMSGPYSIQSMVSMFGCVMLPLLFEKFIWKVSISALQMAGIIAVLLSFVCLNLNKGESSGMQKGFYGWAALLFFANGIYSTIILVQQRWTGQHQRSEMIAVVFLTLAVVSVLYLIFGCKINLKDTFRLKKSSWCYALSSSISLCIAMNLLMILLRYVNASVLYPIQNSAILILQILMSAVCLKEKTGKFTIPGVAFALMGIAALSL